MSDTSNAIPLPGDEDGAAAAMELVAEQANQSAEAPETKADEGDQVEEAPTSEEAEAEAPEEEATPETEAPEAEADAEDSVLNVLPDDIRSDFEAAETIEEKQAVLKGAILRQKDYTKKTQALAEEKREIEAIKQKAAWWDQYSADPKALLDADDDAEPFDHVGATPEEFQKYLDDRDASRAARAAQESQSAESARDAYLTSLNDGLETYAEINSLDEDAMFALTKRVGESFDALGVDPASHLSVENLNSVLDRERKLMSLEAKASEVLGQTEESKSDAARVARASSPPATRTGTIKDKPTYEAEGRPPKPGEVADHTIRQLREAGVDFDGLTG